MDLDEVTIADTFKAAGYATGAFGKWHNGMQYPYHPNGRGFDEYYGFASGHWGDYFSPPLERNGKIVQGEGFLVDDLTDKAMKFMEKNRDGPFFAYIPYNTPHSPMQVPDEFWERFKDKEIVMRNREPEGEVMSHLRSALAMCENIDWNVGRVLEKLDDLGIADNTIVVYFHDNGPNGVRWNGDMKGRKGSIDEGGVRTAMHMRWPAKFEKGKVVKQIGSGIDLHPTLADLAGIPTVNKKRLDGRSLKPLLLEDNPDWKAAEVVASHHDLVHHQHLLEPAAFEKRLPKLAWHGEDADVTVMFFHPLFEHMANHVKVGLCGQGADELHAGYPRYGAGRPRSHTQTAHGRPPEPPQRSAAQRRSLA